MSSIPLLSFMTFSCTVVRKKCSHNLSNGKQRTIGTPGQILKCMVAAAVCVFRSTSAKVKYKHHTVKCFVMPRVVLFFGAQTVHIEPEVLSGISPLSRAHCHNHHHSRTKGVNSQLFGIFLCSSSYDLLSSCPQICSNLAATSA